MTRQFRILGILVLLGASVPVITDNRFALDIIILILIYATFATGWNIAAGFTGLFSLGHAALFAIGAYGAVIPFVRWNVPVLISIVMAAFLSVLASLLLGLMSLRLRGHYFALATIGFVMTAYILLSNFRAFTGGDEGINVPFAPDPWNLIFPGKVPYLYLGLGLYAVTAAATIFLAQSKLGYQMRAIREDEVTARSMGVDAFKVKLTAVSISGLISSFAGSLFAFYTLYITPQNTSDITNSLEPALMSIIGGMMSIYGPLVGAILIITLEQQVITVVGAAIPGLSQAVYAILLIVSILVLPNGILGIASKFTKRLTGKTDANDTEAVEMDADLENEGVER